MNRILLRRRPDFTNSISVALTPPRCADPEVLKLFESQQEPRQLGYASTLLISGVGVSLGVLFEILCLWMPVSPKFSLAWTSDLITRGLGQLLPGTFNINLETAFLSSDSSGVRPSSCLISCRQSAGVSSESHSSELIIWPICVTWEKNKVKSKGGPSFGTLGADLDSELLCLCLPAGYGCRSGQLPPEPKNASCLWA